MVAASQSEFGQRVEQQKALKLFRFDTESGKAVSGTAKISPANNGGCTLYIAAALVLAPLGQQALSGILCRSHFQRC